VLIVSFVTFAWASSPHDFYDLGIVLRGSGTFSGGVGAPSVEYEGDSGKIVMYFESPVPGPEVPAGCANSYQIGRATSMDGVTWTVDEAPVWSADPTVGSPRACSVAQPAVLFDGTRWNLFYSASKVPNEGETTNAPSGIGWAVSDDGITWSPQEEQAVPFEGSPVGLASATALNGTMYLSWASDPDLWMMSRPINGGAWSAAERIVDHAAVGAWGADWVLGPSLLCNEAADNQLGMLAGGDSATGVRSLAWGDSGNAHSWTFNEPISEGTLDATTLNHWDTLRAGLGFVLWYSRTDPTSGLKAVGVALTDTRLGTIVPRVCPNPWANLDTGDTGDTGTIDTGDTADTSDTADSGAGVDTDTADTAFPCDCVDEQGCNCATGGSGVAGFAAALGLLAALARRRDNA